LVFISPLSSKSCIFLLCCQGISCISNINSSIIFSYCKFILLILCSSINVHVTNLVSYFSIVYKT
jgi:hypothetical protein